jgi:GntR family transcriptional regulator
LVLVNSPILSQISLDRHSPVPLYRQLWEQLERLVANGTWQPKEPMPSDNVLAEAFQISVMTVRQAMAELVNQGLIYREQGRGTFVSPRPFRHHLQRLEGFTEDILARGLTPSARILAFERVTAGERLGKEMQLDPASTLLHVKRLRLADGRLVAIHDAYLTHTQLTLEELKEVGSLYTLLEHKGVQMVEADETLEAITADRELADLLQIERGAPLLRASRLSWDRASAPVEFVQATYRADFYRYTVRLRR